MGDLRVLFGYYLSFASYHFWEMPEYESLAVSATI